jgi:putative N6-adenine-specific DNA methylase
MLDQANTHILPAAEGPVIQASDRDSGAIEMASANAERAGVLENIEFSCRAVSAIEPPQIPGWVITNPPYGVRLSQDKDLRDLYAQFGNVLRRACPGWEVAVLCNQDRLLGQMGIKFDQKISLVNGGVGVKLARGKIAAS